MLNGEWGLLNNVLYTFFGIEGPVLAQRALDGARLGHRRPTSGNGCRSGRVILLAGRMAIPLGDLRRGQGRRRDRAAPVRPHHLPAARQPLSDLHAALDDLPRSAISTRCTFVSGGGPANSTHVLATLGIRDAFDLAQPAARRGGGDVGAAAADPAGDHPDAQAPHRRRCSYEHDHGRDARLAASPRASRGRCGAARRRRYLSEPGDGGALPRSSSCGRWCRSTTWCMVSLEPEGDVFTDHIWPAGAVARELLGRPDPGLLVPGAFLAPVRQQRLSSARTVTFLTLLIGSLTSFSIGRMRIRHGWLVSNAALLTYVIPASFLAIPFYRIMQNYGLTNNLWSVIAADGDLRDALRDLHLPAIRPEHPDRARRVGADRRRLAAPDLSARSTCR